MIIMWAASWRLFALNARDHCSARKDQFVQETLCIDMMLRKVEAGQNS